MSLRTLFAAIVSIAAAPALAQQQSATSVEKLLTGGWEVAGYISADNRSLILFKHKDHKYLVQCSLLIDVLRTPRVVTYCYEIK